MTETRKPLNPLEREEKIGIKDGSSHAGEPVTRSRHGTGTDPAHDGRAARGDLKGSDPAKADAFKAAATQRKPG